MVGSFPVHWDHWLHGNRVAGWGDLHDDVRDRNDVRDRCHRGNKLYIHRGCAQCRGRLGSIRRVELGDADDAECG
jgi:hypothetical protein